MGQAALDLPDPLESPQVSSASTDDLLAQMAGEEIERLLSESDEAEASATPSASAAAAPSGSAPASAPATPAPSAPKAESSSTPAGATQAPSPRRTDQDLSALFSQLDATEAEPASKPEEQKAAPADAVPSVAEELAREMDEDAAAPMAPASAVEASLQPVKRIASGDPLVLRMLALLSAPLDAFGDQVRDVVGKIAILTTVNALSVLVYVLFFRHH